MQVPYDLLEKFNIKGAINSIAPLGYGHINDSYSVQVGEEHFLLQRLNTEVFLSPEVVEQNLRNVLTHAPELFPEHLCGENGKIHQLKEAEYWRMQEFVQHSYSPEELSLSELRQIAKGFGKFTLSMSSAKLSAYQEAISAFHSLSFRLNQFRSALEKDSADRAQLVKAEIEKVNSFQWIEQRFEELKSEGLPKRICHNDAKAGNCLLSKKTGEFLKVVDLDTVGPGYVMFDLGDMLRSMLFNIPENHTDLEGLSFDNSRFNTILEGYLAECGEALVELEVKTLGFGGLYMTFMMAVRFLTDYLNGDVYYKTSFKDENLVRARNQLRILELMQSELKL